MRARRPGNPTRRWLVAAAALAALLAGCDMCEEGDLRCVGNVVQECSSRDWQKAHDCGADTCGVGRDVCHPFFDPGFGEVWCCLRSAEPGAEPGRVPPASFGFAAR